MNAFRLYVGFTPSAATGGIQLETPALLRGRKLKLCKKAQTPLLLLTALPTATEHSSDEGLTEQLWCWWRTSFILGDLEIYKQQYWINTRPAPRGDWIMKAKGRQKSRVKHFLPSVSTIFTSPLSSSHFFIPSGVYSHLRERKFNCTSCEYYTERQRNKQTNPKQTQNTPTDKINNKRERTDWWRESFATMRCERWKNRLKDKRKSVQQIGFKL